MIEYEYNGRLYDIIPLNEMETGGVYTGKCRNATYAYWNGMEFIYFRTKWGQTFLEKIPHPENEKHFDVFLPFEHVDGNTLEAKQLINAINNGLINKKGAY